VLLELGLLFVPCSLGGSRGDDRVLVLGSVLTGDLLTLLEGELVVDGFGTV
jgi:hypothetical protein